MIVQFNIWFCAGKNFAVIFHTDRFENLAQIEIGEKSRQILTIKFHNRF